MENKRKLEPLQFVRDMLKKKAKKETYTNL